MLKRLANLLLLFLLIISTAYADEVTALIADAGDQAEADIYGRHVVYRDYRYDGIPGKAVFLYDLSTGAKTMLNPTWRADNHPAVGENRVIWCDRRWDSMAIVSTVIGSGVEDVLVQEGGSVWGLDVNDRWAMWYHFRDKATSEILTYNFSTGLTTSLSATVDTAGYFDAGAHLDHVSDKVLLRSQAGSFLAIELGTSAVLSSTAQEYALSQHGYYNGRHVWEGLSSSDTGYDIFISHAPEPSSVVSLICGLAVLIIPLKSRTVLRRS